MDTVVITVSRYRRIWLHALRFPSPIGIWKASRHKNSTAIGSLPPQQTSNRFGGSFVDPHERFFDNEQGRRRFYERGQNKTLLIAPTQ
jgi:hypothetical protein